MVVQNKEVNVPSAFQTQAFCLQLQYPPHTCQQEWSKHDGKASLGYPKWFILNYLYYDARRNLIIKTLESTTFSS